MLSIWRSFTQAQALPLNVGYSEGIGDGTKGYNSIDMIESVMHGHLLQGSGQRSFCLAHASMALALSANTL